MSNQNNNIGESPSAQGSKEAGQKNRNSTKKKIWVSVLALLVVAAAIYGWNWYTFAVNHESTDNAQVDGNISPVIPRVDGYVQKIYVDDNQRVKKGDLLVKLDKRNFKLGVKQAKAGLKSAKAAYADAKAGLASAQAQVSQAKVALRQSRTEMQRQKRLMADSSTTQQHLDNAQYAFESAQAQYTVAQRHADEVKVKVQQANANIEKAQSALENANLNLSYTELHAPISGVVSQKDIESGQYVRPGQPVMAIANDKNVWVKANFKEGQISQIDVGEPVDIEVDAYPDRVFKGKVQSIAGATGSKFELLPPDNASGNFVKVEQRIPVKIMFTDPKDPDAPLKPGMNAVPTVQVN
ncbi:MAG TPA: HlyD family secretion protein [Balneolaceae bacterium]|nr:HlyD family secretion protein [Balneolaceae bacterium]